MADKDYFSFDEVLADLKMEEDDLKRLVSAGEIRAFRDKDTMRFKAEDVARLKQVPPGDELELEELGDELELELEGELEEATLELEPEPAAAAPGKVEEIDLVPETPAAPRKAVRAPAAAAPSGGARRSGKAAAAAAQEVTEGVGTLVMLIFTIIVLFVASMAVIDSAGGRGSNALTKAVSNIFK